MEGQAEIEVSEGAGQPNAEYAPLTVAEYDRFVLDSDQSLDKPEDERLDIATFGLAAEIGSVVAAIKKRLLGEGGSEDWSLPNDEILEELGDVMWYSFSLARHANPHKPVNVFAHDIQALRKEIGASDDRAGDIQRVLDPAKREAFLEAAKLPGKAKWLTFEDYQQLAFLTARTKERTLVEVCVAVLYQLSAQLFRRKLPAIEQMLNQQVADRPINDILGEIAWHVSALASIYGLTLSAVARRNMEKVAFRQDRSHPTPLHDENCLPGQRLPRVMEVSFVTVSKGRSRMYWDGKQLGHELTDNFYEDDGYRFHDVMHLANLAKLGWSPVFRSLMGRKRKGDPLVDDVEDGARAQIVEEAVIKAIHSEGTRLAKLRGPQPMDRPIRLMVSPRDITFRFLKFIHNFVSGLEVEANRYWEWEEAILEGNEIFYQLRREGQGTVTIDLEKRSMQFRPEVCVDVNGRLVGMGSASVLAEKGESVPETKLKAQRLAILNALGLDPMGVSPSELEVVDLEGGKVSTKASGAVRDAMWSREIITFRTTEQPIGEDRVYASAVALADRP